MSSSKTIESMIYYRNDEKPMYLINALINLGLVEMKLGNFKAASSLFEKCLMRFFPCLDNIELLMLLAKSLFSMQSLEACKLWLLKGLRVEPWNLKLRFNLALCEE